MLLQCQDVTKTFHTHGRELQVLKGINFSIESGESVMIYGKSGQGKSVLLSLLCGLDVPTSGDIIYQHTSLRLYSLDLLAELRRDHIGIIFQNSNLIPSWTAIENVEAALEGSYYSSRERRNKSAALLDLLKLGDRFHHLPSELSMGEQQRVAIARALVRDPKIILGDEPTGDLDEETAHEILRILFFYLEEQKTSLLITSHGHFPIQYIDRMYFLNDGKLVLNQEELQQVSKQHTTKLITLN